ncbi:DEAD/DEAH box helicase [Deltaproteobacteria bacterium]|nr:DEAD/DEAH box helicase [Deltaproteobacteria bacterium]
MPFENAHPTLVKALTEKGYAEPTPVQAAVLDTKYTGRDLLVSAQTGSGKTVAFGLALAPVLLGEEGKMGAAKAPLALVVAPTRELAMQVQRELAWLYAPAGGKVIACVGGMDIRTEARQLHMGAHIVVGTPGRLCDHLDRGRLTLDSVVGLVLDEADEMLDLGFRDELEHILQATPPDRRTLLFSATVPKGIESLASSYQRNAARVAVAAGEAHADIEYRAVVVVPREAERAIVNVLRFVDAPGALVFCRTRDGVNRLQMELAERGFAAVALSGELGQAERNRALQALRDRRARVCVATDVAARGLDLPDLGLVIHAEVPTDSATLLHRSGRTGRAGRKGMAVVLVPGAKQRLAERIFREAGVDPKWMGPPSAESIRQRDEVGLRKDIAELAADVPEEDLAVAKELIATGDAERYVAALVRLQRAQLPAPEEVSEWRAPPPLPKRERPATRNAEYEDTSHGFDAEPMDGTWFRINVGHTQRADPKWLLPMLCRRGGIQKQHIGGFRVLRHESRVLIHPAVAERFAKAAGKPDPADPNIRIVPWFGGG